MSASKRGDNPAWLLAGVFSGDDFDPQNIAGLSSGSGNGLCWKLQNAFGAEIGPDDGEGANRLVHCDYSGISVEQHDVNREAHSDCVNGIAGDEPKAAVRIERTPA